MRQLSTVEFERKLNTPASGLRGLLIRSLFRGRGYRYHTYRTTIENYVFTLCHYSTNILTVDLSKGVVLHYGGWSISDRQAIDCALWQLGLGGEYHVEMDTRPPSGLVIWKGNTPLKSNGTPYTLSDFSEDEVDWLKRRRKRTLLRDAAKGWHWATWAYGMLYGDADLRPMQTTLTGEPPVVPVGFLKEGNYRRGRCFWGWRDCEQKFLTQWIRPPVSRKSTSK